MNLLGGEVRPERNQQADEDLASGILVDPLRQLVLYGRDRQSDHHADRHPAHGKLQEGQERFGQ